MPAGGRSQCILLTFNDKDINTQVVCAPFLSVFVLAGTCPLGSVALSSLCETEQSLQPGACRLFQHHSIRRQISVATPCSAHENASAALEMLRSDSTQQ